MGVAYTGNSTEATFVTTDKPLAKERMAQAGLPTPAWLRCDSPSPPCPSPTRAAAARGRGEFSPPRHSTGQQVDHQGGLGAGVAKPGRRGDRNGGRRRGIAPPVAATDRPVGPDRALPSSSLRDGSSTCRSSAAAQQHVSACPRAAAARVGEGQGVRGVPPSAVRRPPSGPPPSASPAAGRKSTSRPFRRASRGSWAIGRSGRSAPSSFKTLRDGSTLLTRKSRYWSVYQALARDCWSLFGLRGYVRVDFRVDDAGQPWILEVNTNPCLSPDAGFVAALKQAAIPVRGSNRPHP